MASPGQLMVMARPGDPLRRDLHRAIAPRQLAAIPGNALFASRNWHQSLSDWHQPDQLDALRRACAGLHAHAFCMRLDRIVCSGREPGAIHWSLRPSAGNPDGLFALLAGLRAALAREAIIDPCRHTAHITLSYFAREPIAAADFEAVDWLVDAIELVEARGHGDEYHYHAIDAWPLLPPRETTPRQLGLLA